jgi:hypothetical protein
MTLAIGVTVAFVMPRLGYEHWAFAQRTKSGTENFTPLIKQGAGRLERAHSCRLPLRNFAMQTCWNEVTDIEKGGRPPPFVD